MESVKNGFVRLLMGCFCCLIMAGCSNDDNFSYGEFRLDLLTVIQRGDAICFLSDDRVVLLPDNPQRISELIVGDRVMVNYTYTSEDKEGVRNVKVSSFGYIFTDRIRDEKEEGMVGFGDDPIYLESIWVSGGYVNVRFQIEINSTKHRLALVATDIDAAENGEVLHLMLKHDAKDDSRGPLVRNYASFRLGEKLKDVQKIYVRLKTTNYGVTTFPFDLKK